MKHHRYPFVLFAALTGLSCLVSCIHQQPEQELVRHFSHELLLADANDRISLSLEELQAPVKTIEGIPDWMAARLETTAEGLSVLWLEYQALRQADHREATLAVTAENRNTAEIRIIQKGDFTLPLLVGAKDSLWLADWETFDVIALNGMDHPQYTPWHNQAESPANLAMFKDMTKHNGWEMVFSSLNDLAADGRRYFGLYSRWLGILRVFCYVKDPGREASELVFEVDMGSEDGNRYPFYNALEYSIPTNHSAKNGNLDLYVNLLGGDNPFSFKDLKTPYSRSVSSVATKGWNAVDIDMTGFVPEGSPWMDDGVDHALFINSRGREKRAITLAGSISANISGTQTEPEILNHGAASVQSGFSGFLSMMGSFLGGMKSKAQYARDAMTLKDYENEYVEDWSDKAYMKFATFAPYVGIGCTLASGILDWMYADDIPVEQEKVPGKIDLTLDGTIDLKGEIKSYTSTGDIGSINVYKSMIREVNFSEDGSPGHVGSGIISLAEDPVLCVAKEDLMANTDHFNLSVKGDGKYTNQSIASNYVRLITFLDPSSIKLNLNTALYDHQVTDVHVSASYCVFHQAPFGHTEPFRQMLGLDRPSIDLSMGATSGLNRYNATSRIRVHKVTDTDLLDTAPTDDPETPENTKYHMQAGAPVPLKYFGREANVAGKPFLQSPQVFIPFSQADGTTVMTDGQIPDFVVCIYVSFLVNGKPFTFTQHYLPRIEPLDHSGLVSRRERLRQFAGTCNSAKPVGTLANDPSVPVFFPYGGPELDKTLKMLDRVFEE